MKFSDINNCDYNCNNNNNNNNNNDDDDDNNSDHRNLC